MRLLLPILTLIAGLVAGYLGGYYWGAQQPPQIVEVPAPVPEPEPQPAPEPAPQAAITPANFTDLDGWATADMAPALQAFQRSCATGSLSANRSALKGHAHYEGDYANPAKWQMACAAAIAADDAKLFFETYFQPHRLTAPTGKLTGYYEPELKATTAREGLGLGLYHHPLYGWPSDLVAVDPAELGGTGPRVMGRLAQDGRSLTSYAPRAEIDDGKTPAEPLAWLADPAELFFLHIQGSGRLTLLDEEGRAVRAAFAAKNGQPYKSIGRYLLDNEMLPRSEATAEGIKNWLRTHPVEAVAVMQQNPSFIFFKLEEIPDPALGPKGAEGVPLTGGASLAVDLSQHLLGTPLWVEATDPAGQPLNRLGIAQDTGSAILGKQRVDLFVGTGQQAGVFAGTLHQDLRLWVLLPKAPEPEAEGELDGGE